MKDNMNVIFIMTDQQRADSIGPNRTANVYFPNMENLRQESVSFDNFYTAASPCVPSRHSYLTGRQPWKNGVHGNLKFGEEGDPTWMQLLRDRGYKCVSVGKTHMVHAGSFHIQVPVGKTFGDSGDWNHFEPAASPEEDDLYYDIHATRRACDALDRLDDGEDPFAMFIGFHAPHEPYVMPEKYLDYCKPEDVTLPKNRSEEEYETKSESYRRRVNLFKDKFGNITDDMMRKGIAGHYCLLKMVDDCLGMIMNKLKESKLLENTLIIFASDHGEMLGEHGIFNKAATSYEAEIRVPFMVRFPDGYKAGETVESLGSSIDFVPTLFDMMNLTPDISLPGRSLVPTFQEGKSVRDYVTLADGNGMMGIRTKNYKLWYSPHFKDGEMYDLMQDPQELNNLYHNPAYQSLRGELFELMLHARAIDDERDNAPTKRDKLRHKEVKASYEPEVV
ncbi:sulfatase family protein [Gracilibacillus sp. D59]|uniref:sulfatase family protein n=1 Tax=Gracilibacillus sp. D59 TaxID=3457434 RepID=UPI003FCCBD2D